MEKDRNIFYSSSEQIGEDITVLRDFYSFLMNHDVYDMSAPMERDISDSLGRTLTILEGTKDFLERMEDEIGTAAK